MYLTYVNLPNNSRSIFTPFHFLRFVVFKAILTVQASVILSHVSYQIVSWGSLFCWCRKSHKYKRTVCFLTVGFEHCSGYEVQTTWWALTPANRKFSFQSEDIRQCNHHNPVLFPRENLLCSPARSRAVSTLMCLSALQCFVSDFKMLSRCSLSSADSLWSTYRCSKMIWLGGSCLFQQFSQLT